MPGRASTGPPHEIFGRNYTAWIVTAEEGRVVDSQSPQVLLVDCPDQRGLIHAITGVLMRHEANILTNDEFVDRESAALFHAQRVRGMDCPRGSAAPIGAL